MSACEVENLSVLFVDDQPFILNMIRSFLEARAPGWNVRYANSGQQALACIAENPPEVVVSDINMPEMDGNSFLRAVKERHPSLLRVILSGELYPSSILDSIGVAHQRLTKPVNLESLIRTLDLSRSIYNQIKDPGVQGIISNFDNLPVPRESYFTVKALLDNPNVDIEEISNVIREDVMISTHVLRLVNSAFIGRGHRIDSIKDAVMLLGMNNLQSLILMIGLLAEKLDDSAQVIDINAFSKHALSVAEESRLIAKAMHFDRKNQETAFTTGLLQNIGKIVISDLYKDDYSSNGLKEDPYRSFMRVEETGVAAYQHPLIGAALLALWGLPGNIVNAVAHHHHPKVNTAEHHTLSLPVHIAEGIVNFESRGKSGCHVFESGMINTQLIQEIGLRETIEDYLIEKSMR